MTHSIDKTFLPPDALGMTSSPPPSRQRLFAMERGEHWRQKAAHAKANPFVWTGYEGTNSGNGYHVTHGRLRAFTPAGHYQGVIRGGVLYIRYIGDSGITHENAPTPDELVGSEFEGLDFRPSRRDDTEALDVAEAAGIVITPSTAPTEKGPKSKKGKKRATT